MAEDIDAFIAKVNSELPEKIGAVIPPSGNLPAGFILKTTGTGLTVTAEASDTETLKVFSVGVDKDYQTIAAARAAVVADPNYGAEADYIQQYAVDIDDGDYAEALQGAKGMILRGANGAESNVRVLGDATANPILTASYLDCGYVWLKDLILGNHPTLQSSKPYLIHCEGGPTSGNILRLIMYDVTAGNIQIMGTTQQSVLRTSGYSSCNTSDGGLLNSIALVNAIVDNITVEIDSYNSGFRGVDGAAAAGAKGGKKSTVFHYTAVMDTVIPSLENYTVTGAGSTSTDSEVTLFKSDSNVIATYPDSHINCIYESSGNDVTKGNIILFDLKTPATTTTSITLQNCTFTRDPHTREINMGTVDGPLTVIEKNCNFADTKTPLQLLNGAEEVVTSTVTIRSAVTLTASGNITLGKDTILLDGTSAVVDGTLYASSGVYSLNSRQYTIKALDITNQVRVLPGAGDTIEGLTAYTFASSGDSVTLQLSGTDWLIMNEYKV